MTNPFEVFSWDESYTTGIPQIDEQHQILVQFLNTLASSQTFHVDIPSSRMVLQELTEYAAYHFQTEEGIWSQFLADDSWVIDHKKAHKDFVSEVSKLKEASDYETLEELLGNVVSFLTLWLKLHILESDKRIAKVVLALKSGSSLEQAKQQANREMSI